MSFSKYLLSLSFLIFLGCSNAPDRPEPELQQNNTPDLSATNVQTTPPATPPAQTESPAQNAKGVWHYTCADGCEGGAASAQACGVCGKTLVHNKGYHENQPNQQNPTNTITNPTDPASTAQKPPAAAQNANGVWHFTCADGCAGGAGAAQACSGCGKTLAHNAAYHQ